LKSCKSNLSSDTFKKNDVRISEILAVIKRAIILDSTKKNKVQEPRAIQFLAVLVMLNQVENKGRLAEVATGEGKSTIISILAVIIVLQGYKIHINTSSIELAKRDIKEKSDFYKMFNINVKDNSDDNYNFNGLKECYDKNVDIVYGETSNFQFDILREDFSGLGTMGLHSFENIFAIVDEVDSMLIDDSSKIAMLAENMPGMSHLNILFTTIWQIMEDICSKYGFLNRKSLKYGKLFNSF
jgi:preprotein translocase subunit SecA